MPLNVNNYISTPRPGVQDPAAADSLLSIAQKLQGLATDVKSELATDTAAVTALAVTVVANTAGIASLNADVVALDLDVTANTADILTNTIAITGNTTNITALTTAEAADAAAISALQIALGTLVVGGIDGVYSVKDYGAVGNGVTDDTAACCSALAAAKSNAHGHATLYFPPGAYRVTAANGTPGVAAFDLAEIGGLSIRGEVAGGCGSGGGNTNFKGSIILCDDVAFYLETNGGDNGDWDISGLGFQGIGRAIRVHDNTGGTIRDCGFWQTGANPAIDLTSCSETRITNNRFYVSKVGIYIHVSNRIVMTGNVVESLGGTGISIDGTSFSTFTGNYVNAWVYGIEMLNTNMCTVSSNVIQVGNAGSIGIEIAQGGATNTSAVISGNTISTVAGATGIDLYGAQNCVVIGNIIDAPTAINLATNGGNTCAGDYYDANVCVAYVPATYGVITVGVGTTATAGYNVGGV